MNDFQIPLIRPHTATARCVLSIICWHFLLELTQLHLLKHRI